MHYVVVDFSLVPIRGGTVRIDRVDLMFQILELHHGLLEGDQQIADESLVSMVLVPLILLA